MRWPFRRRPMPPLRRRLVSRNPMVDWSCPHCRHTVHNNPVPTRQGVVWVGGCCCDHHHCPQCNACLPAQARICHCGFPVPQFKASTDGGETDKGE